MAPLCWFGESTSKACEDLLQDGRIQVWWLHFQVLVMKPIRVAKGYHPICFSLILVVLDLNSVRIQAENQPTLRKSKEDDSIKSCKSTLTMFDSSISPLNNIKLLNTFGFPASEACASGAKRVPHFGHSAACRAKGRNSSDLKLHDVGEPWKV